MDVYSVGSAVDNGERPIVNGQTDEQPVYQNLLLIEDLTSVENITDFSVTDAS